MTRAYESWGRLARVAQRGLRLAARPTDLRDVAPADDSMLPYGNGRSYGDSCLNPVGVVLDTRGMDRYLSFDAESGVLRCDAGVLLSELIETFGPRGWFVPVTPGTKFVTIGGCIANDVHGKNHHRNGTFGEHVLRFELLRSDGSSRVCSRTENPEWFAATVGGLGLTGLITWVEMRLRPIPGLHFAEESVRFGCLEEFFSLSEESDAEFEYTVAWIDCMARGRTLGRGLFLRGNHIAHDVRTNGKALHFGVPFTPPISLVMGPTLRLFNEVYYRKQLRRCTRYVADYNAFLYPLDHIRNWNRIYGPRGMLQYQSVVPRDVSRAAVHELLRRISQARTGSFLAVLKMFADRPPVGLLSFPRDGATLTLDFPYQGERTEGLLATLDEVVMEAGGALYPAKDARMPPTVFAASFPSWPAFESFIDPRFTSAFLRRVRGASQ